MKKLSERINALSVDLEEWHQIELMKNINTPKNDLIGVSTAILLDLFSRHNTKATFFIVGEVAKKNPELIKRIFNEGHEIAIHGFTHSILHDIGPDGLRNELKECQKIIKEILGDIKIKGFRAPSFSLNQDTHWAIDILKEFKIKYDSSLFPVKNILYGINGIPLDIYGISSNNIKNPDAGSPLKEFPITAFEFFKLRIPVSGGFYLRLIPICIQKRFLKSINKDRPFIIYIHPWECYANTPKTRLGIQSSFVTYYNIGLPAIANLDNLLNSFIFDRIDKILGI